MNKKELEARVRSEIEVFLRDEQSMERFLKLVETCSAQAQKIISLEREVNRKDKLLANMYQQVHGRPPTGVF